MVGPQRKQRTPPIAKPVGTEFSSIAENKSKEEQKQRTGKVPHYTPKKKVILLPGPVEEKKK
jgi:hypothetical protein